MRPVIFELCAETIEGCIAAAEGGADRIELCSDLHVGGLTPCWSLLAEAGRTTSLPLHVLIRPRAGNFCYSKAEVEIMLRDIDYAKQIGASGVVLGALTADCNIDLALTRLLVQASRPMDVTFHRAFDQTPSPPAALEAIVELGCDRVLTSGGHSDVLIGASALQALVVQAGSRINIAVGGGLRFNNASSVARITNATHFHGSLREEGPDANSVREMIQRLNIA